MVNPSPSVVANPATLVVLDSAAYVVVNLATFFDNQLNWINSGFFSINQTKSAHTEILILTGCINNMKKINILYQQY